MNTNRTEDRRRPWRFRCVAYCRCGAQGGYFVKADAGPWVLHREVARKLKRVEQLGAEVKQLRSALSGLLPRGWRDGTMDHMKGVKAARLALGGRKKRSVK